MRFAARAEVVRAAAFTVEPSRRVYVFHQWCHAEPFSGLAMVVQWTEVESICAFQAGLTWYDEAFREQALSLLLHGLLPSSRTGITLYP